MLGSEAFNWSQYGGMHTPAPLLAESAAAASLGDMAGDGARSLDVATPATLPISLDHPSALMAFSQSHALPATFGGKRPAAAARDEEHPHKMSAMMYGAVVVDKGLDVKVDSEHLPAEALNLPLGTGTLGGMLIQAKDLPSGAQRKKTKGYRKRCWLRGSHTCCT